MKISLFLPLIIITISCFAQENKSKTSNSPVQVVQLAATEKTWEGSKIKPLQINAPKVSLLKITIKKGVKLSMHKHPVVNVGYMLQGEITVHTESGKSITVKEGESLVEVINQWHYGENTGNKDAVIVVFYIGDKNDLITIKKE